MQAGSTGSLERTPRKVRFAMIAIVLLAAFAIPVTSSAGKASGGAATEPWITLATVDGEAAHSSSVPALGSWIEFASGYPTRTRNPWISLTCYQAGAVVFGEGGVPAHVFELGGASSDWLRSGGAATCRAEAGDLYSRGGQQYYVYLAHLMFDAAG